MATKWPWNILKSIKILNKNLIKKPLLHLNKISSNVIMLLEQQLKKDNEFKTWLKQREEQLQNQLKNDKRNVKLLLPKESRKLKKQERKEKDKLKKNDNLQNNQDYNAKLNTNKNYNSKKKSIDNSLLKDKRRRRKETLWISCSSDFLSLSYFLKRN